MRLSKIFRRGLTLLTAAVLSLTLAVPALADAWVPPDNNVNYYLLDAPWAMEDTNRRTLNIFVSNYCEAGLLAYNSIADDARTQAMTTALKHIELNGLAEDVYTENGKTVMKVNGKKFSSVCDRLFDMDIKASSCPGYRDGAIYVTADNYKPEPHIIAAVHYCDYLGNGNYTLNFTVFRGASSVADYYKVEHYELEENSDLVEVGSGTASLYYMGTASTFKVEDLELRTISVAGCDRSDIPYLTANDPVAAQDQPEPEPPEPAEDPAEAPAEDPRRTPAEEPATVPVEEPEPPAPGPEPDPEQPAKDAEAPAKEAPSRGLSTPAIVAIALAAAAGAFAAVLVIFKKKEK